MAYQRPAKNWAMTQIRTATKFRVWNAITIVAMSNPINMRVATMRTLANIDLNCRIGPIRNIVAKMATTFPKEYSKTKPLVFPNEIAMTEQNERIQPMIKQKTNPRIRVSYDILGKHD